MEAIVAAGTRIPSMSEIALYLAEIARSGGAGHLLDTAEEVLEARDFLKAELPLHKSADAEYDVIEETYEAVSEYLKRGNPNGQRFQVNPFFDYNLARHREGPGSLLTTLEAGAYACFFVFSVGGGGPLSYFNTSKIYLNEAEWGQIVQPLAFLRETVLRDRRSALPHVTMARADAERVALARSVAIFEQIVGPKAGTDNDHGGLNGNYRIIAFYEDRMDRRGGTFGCGEACGQQDCVHETQTTRFMLELLHRHGLFAYHGVDQDNSFVELGKSDHASALIFESLPDGTREGWTVDSWVEDNGRPPQIMKKSEWFEFWRKVFPGNH